MTQHRQRAVLLEGILEDSRLLKQRLSRAAAPLRTSWVAAGILTLDLDLVLDLVLGSG